MDSKKINYKIQINLYHLAKSNNTLNKLRFIDLLY